MAIGRIYLIIMIPLFSVWLPSAWTGFNSSAYALNENLAASALMDRVYGSHVPQVSGWRAHHKAASFIMKVAFTRQVQTPHGERLYVLAVGDVEHGPDCHACLGLIGAFVAESLNGQMVMQASAPALEMGAYGKASFIKIFFGQFGPDCYGWSLLDSLYSTR